MIQLKKFVKHFIIEGQKLIWPLAAKSRFFCRVYYCFFDRSFGYEQQALIKAKLAYFAKEGIQNGTSSLLRRNIHRLEKGLIMEPRRDFFALDYILETVDVYLLASESADFSKTELDWAYSVLIEYFEAVKTTHKEVLQAKQRFDSISPRVDISSKPYSSESRKTHNIDFESFSNLTQARRSTRWFLNKPVESEKLEKIVSVASQAPSACNRQPFEFMVVEGDSFRKKVAKLPGGTVGFSDNIPCLIAVVGDQSYYPTDRDRHVIYIDSGLASMQLMLAAETLGLSTCAINWPELEKLDEKVSKLLKLPQYKRVVMFIAIGYAKPSGGIPFSEKKSAQQLMNFIKE
ncbi:nitroreductase family protein [Pseudoalteromonas sp. G4]|uniref:nitroreductase family protein n=1 Tax=Pseudoalteromonas sp. G4 TaxID=2992761 RepID=UPI00237D33E3|nr:nitroreductase family protein [Pseudoalteromonas sp. G4]MDE3271225.1 nitroreductase family protein [Pseudoalteromonas sp. G4]